MVTSVASGTPSGLSSDALSKHRDRAYRNRRVPVVIVATDEVSRTGLAGQLRSQGELQVIDDEQFAHVGIVSVEQVDQLASQQIRALLKNGCHHVVLVATELDEAAMLVAVEAGACALLRRSDVVPEVLSRVVIAASNGYGNLPPDLLSSLLAQVTRLHHDVLEPRGLHVNGFSKREVEVLALIADGYDTSEIARKLSYSQRTVKNIVHGVTSRFHLRSRCHAVAYAIRHGVI